MKCENGIAKTVGGGLLVAATLAIWFWPKGEDRVVTPEPVRPVKSAVVAKAQKMSDLHFAATVRADQRKVLMFKQSGRILRMPFDNGMPFKKGDRLAWLDPKDYENELTIAESTAQRNRLDYERKRAAQKTGGVSQQDVSNAEALMKSSEAQVELKRRALEETVIYAPFDGVVAKSIADELDMVTAGSAKEIMIVQDTTNIKVDAKVPETVVIAGNAIQWKDPEQGGCTRVTFDAMPDRSYPARFVEYEATSERNVSQTYVSTFIMENPTDLRIMPGMSATVTISGSCYVFDEKIRKNPLVIPESAVGAASDGSAYVWVLEKTDKDGVFAAKRRTVEVEQLGLDTPIVKSGLAEGERVAAAGVTILTEGQLVSLIGE